MYLIAKTINRIIRDRYLRVKTNEFLKKKFPSCQINENIEFIESHLEGNNILYPNVKIVRSTIGAFSYVNSNTIVADSDVGRFCSIGPNTIIASGIHPTNFISTSPVFYSHHPIWPVINEKSILEEKKKVKIGNDVWIGAKVYINDGITIGNGAIIAAGSVVSKNVEPYAIYGGVPAKKIKMRFEDSIIEELEQLNWWNLPLDKLITLKRFFQEPLSLSSIIDFKKNLNELY